jgi:arginyl-tRNA--protein-N-Asp/Glu arginylyltransferase
MAAPLKPVFSAVSEPCGYFPGREMTAVTASYAPLSPDALKDVTPWLGTKFSYLEKGFSPEILSAIAPVCDSCNACVPLRINLDQHRESKSDRQVRSRIARDLQVRFVKPYDNITLYPLMQRYLGARHPESSMRSYNVLQFGQYLKLHTDMLMISRGFSPVAFALINRYGPLMSLEYIAYEPEEKDHSLGKACWLEALAWAKAQGVTHAYIGATNDSPKLKYKQNMRGLETFDGAQWVDYHPEKHRTGPDYRAMLRAEDYIIR